MRDALEAAAGLPVPGNDVVLTIDSRRAGGCGAGARRLPGRVRRDRSVDGRDPRAGCIARLRSGRCRRELGLPCPRPRTRPLFDRATQTPLSARLDVQDRDAHRRARRGHRHTRHDLHRPRDHSTSATRRSPTTADRNYGAVDLRKATASSINTVFGQLAVDLGANDLVAQAEDFGFNSKSVARDTGRHLAHARPERDDDVGDRLGRRGPARRRARQPARARRPPRSRWRS